MKDRLSELFSYVIATAYVFSPNSFGDKFLPAANLISVGTPILELGNTHNIFT